MGTRDAALEVALTAFATQGYQATSLDDLAAELGVTKQAILYHFPSKERLLGAVVASAADQLTAVFDPPVDAVGFERVEATIRATFLVAARRPELLALIREVGRLGPDVTGDLAGRLAPLLRRARAFLEREMNTGRLRRTDPGLLLAIVYAAIVGVATETEVLRALGIEPDVRTLALARRSLIDLLRAALVL